MVGLDDINDVSILLPSFTNYDASVYGDDCGTVTLSPTVLYEGEVLTAYSYPEWLSATDAGELEVSIIAADIDTSTGTYTVDTGDY